MRNAATPLRLSDPTTGVRPKVDFDDSLQLAKAAAAGHRGAQKVIFSQLKKSVHATLYRVLGSNRNIEDLVQDSFIEIFRSLENYRGQAKLTTWADRIVVRVAYRYFRSKGKQAKLETLPAFGSHDPRGQLEAREGLRILYEVLENMSPQNRISFALFAIDGRSIGEVAKSMNISVVAAKARIWRAKRTVLHAARNNSLLATYLGARELT